MCEDFPRRQRQRPWPVGTPSRMDGHTRCGLSSACFARLNDLDLDDKFLNSVVDWQEPLTALTEITRLK